MNLKEPSSSFHDSKACSSSSKDSLWPSPRLAWYSVTMISLAAALANVDKGVISILVQPIKRDLKLSDVEVSLLVGLAFSLFYIAAGLPMSRVADVRNRRNILGGGLALWSGATCLCGLAHSSWQLFIARGLVGAGESVKGPTGASLITDLVPPAKLPRAFAIMLFFNTAGLAGALIVGGLLLRLVADWPSIVVPGIGPLYDWQLVFILCGVPGIAIAVLLFLTVPEPHRKGRKRHSSVPLKDMMSFIGERRNIYIPFFISQGLIQAEIMAGQVWRPAMFERSFGWPAAQAGPALGTVALIMSASGLVLGTILVEYLGRKDRANAIIKSCLIAQFLAFPFSILTPLMPTAHLALASFGLQTLAICMSLPASGTALQVITPNEMRAQITALTLFVVTGIGGTVGPFLVASITDFVLADESKLFISLATFAGFTGSFMIFFMWRVMEPYSRVYSEVVVPNSEGDRGAAQGTDIPIRT